MPTQALPPNPYLTAAQAALEVIDQGRLLPETLRARTAQMPPTQRARVQEICYGTCRHYHYLNPLLAQLLAKPIAHRHRLLHFILLNACYQLEHMRTPPYAVVNESVAAVKGGQLSWADKMINAVLRNFLKRRDHLKQDLTPAAARFAFPEWLYDEIRRAWSEHTPAILAASNGKPPLTLRINQRRTTRPAYLKHLAAADIQAHPTAQSKLGITLTDPRPVEQIPGFAEGLSSVQDESAQLTAAALFDDDNTSPTPSPPNGERILDACAAPGGKTTLLLETAPNLRELVAIDLPKRIHLIRENLTRLGWHETTPPAKNSQPKITIIPTDARQPANLPDTPFHRILLDVPCTGSGILRRHPDIKHRRRPEDIPQLAQQQGELLDAAWSRLAPNGVLLYVTCSILPAENDAVIAAFLKRHAKSCNAKPANKKPNHPTPPQIAPLPDHLGLPTQFGRQRLPGIHPGDGFYYCKLHPAPPN